MPWKWTLMLVVLGACFEPKFSAAPVCGPNFDCPAGSKCGPEGVCITIGCIGKNDTDLCVNEVIDDGVCHAGECVRRGCGDGIVERDAPFKEVCDDGNQTSGDGCSAKCDSLEMCGNAVVDFANGEQCDPAAPSSEQCRGVGSIAPCTIPACGDGIVDAQDGEECDAGAANSPAADADCRPDCHTKHCGNHVVDPSLGEVCDDGNLASGDGCSGDCKSVEVCGNDHVDVVRGEQCDDGRTVGHDGCSSACSVETDHWAQPVFETAPSLGSDAGAYDPHRHVSLIFDGTRVWEWDGHGWERAPGASPVIVDYAVAFDSVRDRLVVYGRSASDDTVVTLEWNGVDWFDVTPAIVPPSRDEPAIEFDAARGRTVLFGGERGTIALRDTWEWDGSAWTENATVHVPSVQNVRPILAYDDARGQLMMLSGCFLGSYDGDWHVLTPVHPLPCRRGGALAFDSLRGRLVAFSGKVPSLDGARDLWAFDGVDWSELASTTLPPHREDAIFVYDSARDELVLFGGQDDATQLADTWQLRDTTFVEKTPIATPPPRDFTFMAYDESRGRTVLWGGTAFPNRLNDTWEWDGRMWRDVTPPAGSPPAVTGTIAYDPIRRRTVLLLFFANGTIAENQTWEWNGSAWTQITTPHVPHLAFERLAFDASGPGILAFGGIDPDTGQAVSQTWRYDGTDWIQLTTATTPPGGHTIAMTADATRGVVVLASGGDATGAQVMWDWTGTDWLQRPASGGPGQQFAPALVYVPAIGRVVLFGNPGEQTWLWDGTAWTERIPTTSPPALVDAAAATDVRGRLVLFGGGGIDDSAPAQTPHGQTFVYSFDAPLVADEACLRTGDDLDGDGLAGCADVDCWWRCTPACPPFVSCPANAPRCGDGACDASFEDKHICPADCD